MILKKLFGRNYPNAKGFTLVELLIVVAIIAILAAIAVPQFFSYRKRGYASMLNSDVKNAFTIAEAYFTESSDAVLNDCTTIINAGYSPSAGIVCAASGFSTAGGTISITGDAGWGLSVNAATIDYRGQLTSAAP